MRVARVELSNAIAVHPYDIEAAFAPTNTLFPRSNSAAADAHQTLALCLDDRAPFGLVDFFTGALERERE
jgi:hypothetical protein